jgi:TonB family protein
MTGSITLTIATLICIVLVYSCAQAQGPLPTFTGEGVLNGKATYLPKPQYPEAAREAKVGGIAVVNVTVDENGDVSSAEIVQAAPLLVQAVLDAAKAAKFPKKADHGFLIYAFAAPGVKMPTIHASAGNWYNTGMILQAVDLAPTLRLFEPETLLNLLPDDWTAERAAVARLGELKDVELKTSLLPTPTRRVIGDRVTVTTVSPEKQNTLESNAIVGSLIQSIMGRLGSRPTDLWLFDLGIQVTNALNRADSRDPSQRAASADLLRTFMKEPVPPGLSKELNPILAKLASEIEKGILTDEDKVASAETLTKIMNTIGFQDH